MVNLNKIAKKLKKEYINSDLSSNLSDPTEFVSTGNKAFDLILEGGIPWGYLTELAGFSSSGKSLFIYQTIANAMRDYDAIGILIDRENAYTNRRGEQLGIDNERLFRAKPMDVPTVFDAFQFIFDCVEAVRAEDKKLGEVTPIAIAIDSISAFGKDVALKKADPGRKAKGVHESLREMLSIIDDDVLIMVANQYTYKVGIMYGNPITTTMGEGTKYYSNVRLALEKLNKPITDPRRNDEIIGSWMEIEVVKTRLGPCSRKCYVRHLYEEGIDYYSGYARLLVQRGHLNPKNKDEFKKFKQVTVKDHEGNEINEHKIGEYLEKHPDLDFNEYPPFYGDDSTKPEEKDE